MIVAHNPALTQLADELGSRDIGKVPTCGYVQLWLEIESWRDLASGCGETREFLYPKLFA